MHDLLQVGRGIMVFLEKLDLYSFMLYNQVDKKFDFVIFYMRAENVRWNKRGYYVARARKNIRFRY